MLLLLLLALLLALPVTLLLALPVMLLRTLPDSSELSSTFEVTWSVTSLR